MRLRFLRMASGLSVVAGLVMVFSASALGAGDANEASCPNEASSGFRSYLADCRGYELVTPAYKDGGCR